MGLDIYLYKAQKVQNKDEKEENQLHQYTLDKDDLKKIGRHPKLAEFICEVENEYYDFDKVNITDELYESRGWSIDERGQTFMFFKKDHELYPLYRKYTTAAVNVELIEWTEEERALLNKYGWNDGNAGSYIFHDIFNKNLEYLINGKDIPTVIEKEPALFGNEIGYQRKGLNGDFYNEWDPNDDYLVVDKERIQYVYDHYIDDEETKEYFKREILDPFVEGETFAIFSW